MNFIYPAVFHKSEEGTFKGYFPDLDACYVEGESLDDAIENANAAAYDWISVELDDEEGQLPPVTEKVDIELKEGDIVRNISVNIRFTDGWDE